MDLQAFSELIAKFGAPIAFSVVLIWHVLKINRSLSDHNKRLLQQLTELTVRLEGLEKIQTDLHRLGQDFSTVASINEHCEQLRKSLAEERKESQLLLKMFVESQLKTGEEPPKVTDGHFLDSMKMPAREPPRSLIVKNKHSYIHVTFSNRVIDEATIEEIDEYMVDLIHANPSIRMLWDLKNTEYISSRFLGIGIKVSNKVKQAIGRFAWSNVHPVVLNDCFRIIKLHRLFAMFPDDNSAISFLVDGSTKDRIL